MTINVHSLLHLVEDVRSLGPLWSHSCFGFENMNGVLKALFHGSQQVNKQVKLIVCMCSNYMLSSGGKGGGGYFPFHKVYSIPRFWFGFQKYTQFHFRNS